MTLRNWREALERGKTSTDYGKKQYYHAEMLNLLEDAEREQRTLVAALQDPVGMLQLLMRRNFEVAIGLFQKDCHHWSTRPCATCQHITDLVQFDFGCNWFRKLPKEQQDRAHGGN